MLYHLKNVYLSKNGSILDENFNFLEDASRIFTLWEKNYKRFNYKSTIIEYTKNNISKLKNLSNELYIYAYSYHNIYPFGHLWDALRQLKEIEDNNIKGKLLIGIDSGHTQYLSDHLKLFGYEKENILSCDCSRNIYFIPNLVVSVDDISLSQLDPKNIEWMRKKYIYDNKNLVLEKIGNKDLNLKLYLSRGNNGKRGVLNEDEVWNFLKTKDFIKITGKEHLFEHIFNFSNAITIVGPHGSLFRNLIFCLKNPNIIEFCPNNRIDKAQMGLSFSIGNKNYKHILVDGDTNYNIKIDIKSLDELLK